MFGEVVEARNVKEQREIGGYHVRGVDCLDALDEVPVMAEFPVPFEFVVGCRAVLKSRILPSRADSLHLKGGLPNGSALESRTQPQTTRLTRP